jgi:hypothetical protein
MKTIYKNSNGEKVEIKTDQGYFFLNITDEDGRESQICIPTEYAKKIAEKIIEEVELEGLYKD